MVFCSNVLQMDTYDDYVEWKHLFIDFLQAKDPSESAKRTKPIKVRKIKPLKMMHGQIWLAFHSRSFQGYAIKLQ